MGPLTPLHRLYPLPVRQASILPAASFRFRLATDTLAVQLTLPPAGCVEDFHLQVVFPATTAVPTAPVKALRAMRGTPKEKAQSTYVLGQGVQRQKLEEENFERVLTIPQRELPYIDKYHEEVRCAAKGVRCLTSPRLITRWPHCSLIEPGGTSRCLPALLEPGLGVVK